eukprot:gnl/TRDRNA2_/TRDRNA2_147134_c1_seq1.p3 gnl/TRDRNA2_/TRDRNA2_147134_c1~~gnl/TRDRNA2_/TRDRNA2_147134_c1_seq1.p3  ORF type:complete len:107 (-),score=16.91 gnl/TRDRNA2_/TRDRNA2_147134_c1_seq1:429-749(-)
MFGVRLRARDVLGEVPSCRAKRIGERRPAVPQHDAYVSYAHTRSPKVLQLSGGPVLFLAFLSARELAKHEVLLVPALPSEKSKASTPELGANLMGERRPAAPQEEA